MKAEIGDLMTSAEEIHDEQRVAWARLSVSWDKWDAIITDQLGPVGKAMIQALNIRRNQQHLDIAAGTGEPGLSIAQLAPSGRVVLTDLAPQMLEVAVRRAARQGIGNVETLVCSADDLPFEDASFDSVSVRFGYMFFPDVSQATTEFVRVLSSGGRLCASVWVNPEANPWTSIVMRAITAEVAQPPADPARPNMFRFAAPGHVSTLYRAAGLRDVAEWDVGTELVTASAAQYWEMMSDHVSAVAAALERVDEPTRDRIAATVIAAASAYEQGGEIRVPGMARCIVGTK